MNALEDYPLIESGYIIAALAVGPLVPLLVGLFFIHRSNTLPEGHKRSVGHNIAYLLKKYAPVFVFLNLGWALFLCISQVVFVYHKLQLGDDITYYMKVNLPAYESMDNINSASSLNSLNVVLSGMRRLNSFIDTGSESRRRLDYGSTLSIMYHTDDWDNMLTEDTLVNICETEKKIRELECINLYQWKSMIPAVFEDDCSYSNSYEESLPMFGLSENSPYVADNTSPTNPQSDILISFFAMGSCGDMSSDDFVALLDTTEVDNVQTTFVSNDFIKREFKGAILDAAYWSIASLILCIAFLVLGVQGGIIATTTLVCIFIAVVNAAAILPYWDYGSFSAFNVMSLFILLGVGANAVLMYHSAFRRVVPSGLMASVDNIVESYEIVSQSVLFTTCAALLSLFSKLASPVIVISQLGAFMGVAVTVFYICFHYIIIPMYIFTSWFHMPPKMHKWLDKVKAQCWSFICCKTVSDDTVAQNNGYQGVSYVEPKSDHIGDSSNTEQKIDDNTKPGVISDREISGYNQIRRSEAEANNEVPNNIGTTVPPPEGWMDNVVNWFAAPFSGLVDSPPPASTSTSQPTETIASPDPNRPRTISGLESQFVVAPKEIVQPPTSQNSVDGDNINDTTFHHNNSISVRESDAAVSASTWWYRLLCNKKTPLRVLGCIMVLIVLFGLLLVAYFTNAKLEIDFGIPQLFVPTSNIGQAMYIVKNYKTDVFTMEGGSVDAAPTAAPVVRPPPSHMPSNIPSITRSPTRPTVQPTRGPTRIPTFTQTLQPTTPDSAPPTTMYPTLAPVFTRRPSTAFPTNTDSPTNTNSPTNTDSPTNTPVPTSTFSPTVTITQEPTPTYSPSVVPSLSPTISPTSTRSPTLPVPTSMPVAKYADYTVTGCWGIHSHKPHIDSDADLYFDVDSFREYSDGQLVDGEFINSGLVSDMQTTCDYIDTHRDDLNVHPDWDKDVDCIYSQYLQAAADDYWQTPYAPPYTVENIMIYWGTQEYISGTLIGVEQNGTQLDYDPVWVCVNISARTWGVNSLVDDTDLAIKLLDRWNDAFTKKGSVQANKYGIPSVVGSDEFTFPILAQEVFFSIELAAIISVAGFVGLLFIFTKADMGLTILGTIGMLTIIAVSLCIHIYLFPGAFDLLDIVVLIAIMGMAVDFPIHLIVEYVAARYDHEMHKERINNNDNNDNEEDVVVQPEGYTSPPLTNTQKYISMALIAPLVLTFLSGLPLLRAEFQLIRKSGQYIVILAVVAYAITVFFLPFLMPLGCRVPFCERICLGSKQRQEEVIQMRDSEHSNQRLSELMLSQDEIGYRSDTLARRSLSRNSRGEVGNNTLRRSNDDVIQVPIRVLMNSNDNGPSTPLIPQDDPDM